MSLDNPAYGETVRHVHADCTGSRETSYEAYDAEDVWNLVDPVRVGLAFEHAEVWQDVASRLNELGSEVYAGAVEAASAWQGGRASQGFQESLQKIHASARSLAKSADQMREMLEEVAAAGIRAKALASQYQYGWDDDERDAGARRVLREMDEDFENAMRLKGPKTIAVHLPNIGQEVDYGQHTSVPSMTSMETTGDGRSTWHSGGFVGNMSRVTEVESSTAPSHEITHDAHVPQHVEPVPHQSLASPPWEPHVHVGTELAGFNPASGASGSFGNESGLSGGVGGSGFGPGAVSGGGPSGVVPGDGVSDARPVSGFGGGLGRGAGVGGGMVPPMAGGAGKDEQERERTTWLAEDRSPWQVEDEPVPPVIGAAEESTERRRRRR